MKKPIRYTPPQVNNEAEMPKPRSNMGPQLEAGGSAVRHGASLQGNQRKAMLLKVSGMKIAGSG